MSGLPETHSDCRATRGSAVRCFLRLKAVFVGLALVLAAAWPAQAETVLKDIKVYFAALPEVVFDDTTYGLDDSARNVLLDKGQNEDWIFKRINAGKATLTAVRPNSVVTMRLMDFQRPVLQVHIQNEKLEEISYWQFDRTGNKLEAHLPFTVLRAAAAAVHDLEFNGLRNSTIFVKPLEGVPPEIISHIDAVEACRILTGPSRSVLPPQDLAKRLKALQCDNRIAIEAQLRRKHAKLPVAKAILDRANSYHR